MIAFALLQIPALLFVAVAYLIGSIPFGYVVGRLVGKIDIRQHGSGNIGATNVGRVLGSKWGMLVFILDLAKGIVPVALLSPVLIATHAEHALHSQVTPGYAALIGTDAADLPHWLPHWQVATGIAAIVGHMFPCWLRFRGGKGVATALGVVAYLAPWPTVAAVLIFVLSFAIWRIVSLASILASIGFAAVQIVLLWPALFSREHWSLTAFSLLVPALIIGRHRSNIARIMRGEEKRYRSGKSGSADT
jgi:glycerol-3-phosphate acyltransferase PlsY